MEKIYKLLENGNTIELFQSIYNLLDDTNINCTEFENLITEICTTRYCHFNNNEPIIFNKMIDKMLDKKINFDKRSIIFLCDNMIIPEDLIKKISLTQKFSLCVNDINKINHENVFIIFFKFGDHINEYLYDIILYLINSDRKNLLLLLLSILNDKKYDMTQILLDIQKKYQIYNFNIISDILLIYSNINLDRYFECLCSYEYFNYELITLLLKKKILPTTKALNNIIETKKKMCGSYGLYDNNNISIIIKHFLINGYILNVDEFVKIINNGIMIEMEQNYIKDFDIKKIEKHVDKKELIMYGFVNSYDEFIELCKTHNNITIFINCVNNIGIQNIDMRCLNNIVGRKISDAHGKKIIDDSINFLLNKCNILPTFETILIAYNKKYYNDILLEKYLSSSNNINKELLDIIRECNKKSNEKKKNNKKYYDYDDLTEASDSENEKVNDSICFVFENNNIQTEDKKKYQISEKMNKIFNIKTAKLEFSKIRTKIVYYLANNCESKKNEIILDNKIIKLLSNKIKKIQMNDIDLLIFEILNA